ncbi:MAG TPA: acyltransferase domain-containing protein, partial [Anaerolineae bacterium]|nr:acyltransferase domain-containing protein [Anaerolineae bacterium]
MPQVAYLFPGQGSQAVGMARALVDRYPAAAEAMAEADDVLGFGLSTLCFEGPEETLTDTINAQPALLAASVAVLRALDQALPGLPAPVA